MKIIGVEFRVGMDQRQDLEVFLHPVEIVFPWAQAYPFGPRASVTIHTSLGDVGTQFELGNLIRARGGMPPSRVTQEEIDAAYESLKKQVERVRL